MAGVNFSQPLLGAGASAKTEFAAAQARTGLNFIGSARFKRGIKAEIGVKAFADASAEFSKFIGASIEGTAFAEARAGIQLQLPLNLFDEFGFAARAEAIAQAAAGLEVGLNLNIGDFVLLAKDKGNVTGLPLEILLLFLEEVSIGGTFEVNVSASAKAHASVTVTGSVIEKAGEKAGFYYTVDAGVGLAAGVGMGFKAGAEFDDFKRFYGRTVDKTVDETLRQILKLLPADMVIPSTNQPLKPWLDAFGPLAKIALRMAYSIGTKISENNPGNSKNDMAVLCDEAVKTFLEEAQRFIFDKLLESGIDSIRKLLEQKVPALGQGVWDGAIRERTELADQLLAAPNEPFQDLADNLTYWKNLIAKSMALVAKIGNPDPQLTEAISIIYCTSELLMEAVRSKINTTTAYAIAIGAGSVSADKQPFKGALNNQPPKAIKDLINATIGGSNNLTYADLLQFLVDDIIVNRVLVAFPELSRFIEIFKTDFAKAENDILKLFLQNACSFDPANPASTQADPHALLVLIVNAIDTFVTDKFKTEILPQVLDKVEDATLRLYIEEVLFEAVIYIKDVGLKSILNWQNNTFDNDDITEALAGTMMLLLGRTVVIVADTFITATQQEMEKSCNEIARKIRSNHSDVQLLNIPVDADAVELMASCVEIGGQVLGPLPDDTRKRVRNLLYQVFEPVAPGTEQTFLASLGDQFFIPNLDQLTTLTNELASIAKERFVLFVEKFILRVGQYILDKLEDLILAVIDLIVNWEKHLAGALLTAAQFLRDLEETNRRINQELIHLVETATLALHNLFQALSSPDLKSRIKKNIKDHFIDKAFDALEDNGVYKALPAEWKRSIRALVDNAVDAVMDNPLLNPVFTAIAHLSNQLDSLLPDVRELDADDNLPEQMMLLILDKIEENIKDHFGGNKPHISPAIDFTYEVWELVDFKWKLIPHHIHISLGRIEINIKPFITIVREAIHDANFYHHALNQACFKLGDALAKELELAANILLKDEKKTEKDRLAKIDQEHNNDLKEIAILTPTALAHFTKAIDVKIHLGGVPMSYLGLNKDEQSRVLIYINGQFIPVKSLILENTLGVKNNDIHLQDYDFRNLNTLGSKVGEIKNAFDAKTGVIKNTKGSIMTDTSMHFSTQEVNKQKLNTPTTYSFSSIELKEQPVSKTVYTWPVKSSSSKPYLQKATALDKNGRRVNNYTIDNNLQGKNNSGSKTNNLLKDRIPGILIQFKVELDEPFVTEGINVLTVVVIERGGNRHQQNVSFTVSAPLSTKKAVPGIISVSDEKTGKMKEDVMTLNKLFTKYVADDKQNRIADNAKKAFNELIGKSGTNPVKPRKVAHTQLKSRINSEVIKKETLIVSSDKGKTEKIELTYASIAERNRKLKEAGLNNARLLKDRKTLKTEKITYEEKLVVLNKDGKIVKSITQQYGPKDKKKNMLEGAITVLKESEQEEKLSGSDFGKKSGQKIKLPLATGDAVFKKGSEDALAYFKKQDELNFKELKKAINKPTK